MPPISSSNTTCTSDSSVSKFTKILPLSIRKDGPLVFSSSSEASGSRSTTSGSASSPHQHQHHAQAESKEIVRVTLTYPSPSSGAMIPNKEISLRLTNDENPSFFYHLRVTEGDFPELKSQQGLLVDFHGFPNQLVTLLERCDANYGGGGPIEETVSGGPKFILVMKIGTHAIVLDIVESNPFKYLCHLSLHIAAGTDGEVKKYLCDVTTGLKREYELLRDKYNHLVSSVETENGRMKEGMEAKCGEISALREELHTQLNSMASKHFQELTGEKEKLLRLQSELATKFENERSDLERRHSVSISSLEERVCSLESENRDLLQHKYKSETAAGEAGNQIKHFEADLKLLQQEITILRKQNDKLDHDYHEKARLCTNLHNRVTLLETDLREKQGLLQRNQELVGSLSETKRNLEDHAAAMVREVEKVKKVNQTASGEVLKANEIIKKLQDEIRSLNGRTKLQAQVTTEQERVIVDRDRTLAELEAKIDTLSNSLTTANSEIEKLRESGTEAESKITKLEETIKSNENMISWLNKQLNDFQGLSNLDRFRQNLASSANQLVGGTGQNPSPIPHHQPHPISAPTAFSNVSNNANGDTGFTNLKFSKLQNEQGAGLGRRFGGYSSVGGNQSTLPNGTPSWMHIYQSTSTPLDDDLSSRLEKVATNPGLGMNYNDLKSRFADPYHQPGGVTATGGEGAGGGGGSGDKKEEDLPKGVIKSGGGVSSNTRPPTWARGRGGRVTLNLPTTGKTATGGLGALRRTTNS